MRRARRHATAGIALVGALAVAATLAVTPGAQAAGGPRQRVTFMLAPKNPALLSYLSRTHNLSASQRTAGLAAAVQSAATRADVVARIEADGFRVDNVTPFSISASAPSSIVAGSLNATTTKQGVRIPASAQTNSPLWSSLGSTVKYVVAQGGPKRRPLSPIAQFGPDFANLYDAKPAGIGAGSDLAIATLQFSGWDSAALTTYSQTPITGLGSLLGPTYDPVASHQYTPVIVPGFDPSDPNANNTGGDLEVSLDQESILAVAPYLRQFAYFARNDDQGEVDALNQVAADAASKHIAALSISWGLCEQEMTGQGSPTGEIAKMHAAFENLTAAGVTVFSASGDYGAYDCSPLVGSQYQNSLAVDSPSNDPLVVGVGGTTVDVTDAQSSWDLSGGGESLYFSRPTYQAGVAPSATGRQVPDIAADGDPASGMHVYDSTDFQWTVVGGTSLASPIMAASLVNVLSAQNRTVGVGDIHSMLYGADSTQIFDVNTGPGNGHFNTGPGYDQTTGLGYPKWAQFYPSVNGLPNLQVAAYSKSATVPLTIALPAGAVAAKWGAGLDAVSPVPTDCSGLTSTFVPMSITAPADGVFTLWVAELSSGGACNILKRTLTVDTYAPTASLSVKAASPKSSSYVVKWSSTDADLNRQVLLIARHAGSNSIDWQSPANSRPPVGTVTKAGLPGRSYTVTMTAFDQAQNTTVKKAVLTLPYDDLNFSMHGWSKAPSASAYLGSYSRSSSPYAAATKSIKAKTYAVQYTSCSQCGLMGVYANGKLLKTINTYSTATKYHVTITVLKGSLAARTITVRPLGLKAPQSKGWLVQFDGFLATP